MGCPFGCREALRKKRSTDRSTAYYKTRSGRYKKKLQNNKRCKEVPKPYSGSKPKEKVGLEPGEKGVRVERDNPSPDTGMDLEFDAGMVEHVRMVTSYWDMAATFVNSGAVDRTMYMTVSGESMAAFSKVAPVLAELREAYDSPSYLVNWEKLIMGEKDAEERLKGLRASFRAAHDQKEQETADVG